MFWQTHFGGSNMYLIRMKTTSNKKQTESHVPVLPKHTYIRSVEASNHCSEDLSHSINSAAKIWPWWQSHRSYTPWIARDMTKKKRPKRVASPKSMKHQCLPSKKIWGTGGNQWEELALNHVDWLCSKETKCQEYLKDCTPGTSQISGFPGCQMY